MRAKAATYVGSGTPVASSRPGSHDLAHTEPLFAYFDTYVGGADVLGGWVHDAGVDVYPDTSEGDLTHFSGLKWITRDGARFYELVCHGGLVRE